MKSCQHEKLGKLIAWVVCKSLKLIMLSLLFVIISTVVYESYTEEITLKIWQALDVDRELELDAFKSRNGIIDPEQGIINFYNKNQKVSI
jgi:hypothetical protein